MQQRERVLENDTDHINSARISHLHVEPTEMPMVGAQWEGE